MKPKKLNFYIDNSNLTCYEKGLDLTNYIIIYLGNDKYLATSLKQMKSNNDDFYFEEIFNSLDKAKEGIQNHFNNYINKYLLYFGKHIKKEYLEK